MEERDALHPCISRYINNTSEHYYIVQFLKWQKLHNLNDYAKYMYKLFVQIHKSKEKHLISTGKNALCHSTKQFAKDWNQKFHTWQGVGWIYGKRKLMDKSLQTWLIKLGAEALKVSLSFEYINFVFCFVKQLWIY